MPANFNAQCRCGKPQCPCIPPQIVSTRFSFTIQEVPLDVITIFDIIFDQPVIVDLNTQVEMTTICGSVIKTQPAPNTIEIRTAACPGTEAAFVTLHPGIRGANGCVYGGSTHQIIAIKP